MSVPGPIDFEQFLAVDMRVGRVTAVEDFPEARKPAWKLTIDFGPEVGVKRSSAQITNYSGQELEGRLVVAVVNFPPRQIGPFMSEGLCLRASDEGGGIILLEPRSDVPPRGRIHWAALRFGDTARSGVGWAPGASSGTGVGSGTGVLPGAGAGAPAGGWAAVSGGGGGGCEAAPVGTGAPLDAGAPPVAGAA